MKSLITFFYLFLIFLSSHAQKVVILDRDEVAYFGTQTLVLEDPTNKLIIDDILKSSNQFTESKQRVFNSPKTTSSFWIKFKVLNTTDKNYYLVINNPLINELSIYTGSDEITLIKKTGILENIDSNASRVNTFIFPLNLPKGKVTTFYIRYYSTWRMELPLLLQTGGELIENLIFENLWFGMFYGALLILFIYNFFLYRIIKDYSFIYFFIFIFFIGLGRAINMGLLFFYILPNYHKFIMPLLYFSHTMIGVSLIAFTVNFLKTRKRVPLSNKVLKTFMVLFLISYVLSFIDKKLWSFLTNVLMISCPVFLIYLCISMYLRGIRTAQYYVIGLSMYLVIIILVALRNLGMLPYSFALFNISDVGFIWTSVFLSLAMGQRYRVLEEDKRAIQDELNRELKLKIEERTKTQEEQERLYESLRNSNMDLDNFVYTASHELKAPVINIEGLINILKDDKLNKEEIGGILGMIKKSIEKFKYTIQDLIELSRVKEMRDEKRIENDIKELVLTTIDNHAKAIQNSKANIKIDTDEYPSIYFSRKNLLRIIDNLLTNAIKFRRPDVMPEIIIKTEASSDYLVLSIRDNGIGINKQMQSKLFSIFRKSDPETEGRGIGLYIVKRVIENEGGKIEFDSKEGKGTIFRVYFKKP